MPNVRHPGIESVKSIVPKSIHQYGKGVWHTYVSHRVLVHWPEIVGEGIARQVEAVRLTRKKLWLYTPDAAWRNEIRMMQLEILQRVNNFAGEKLVDELHFARSGCEKEELQRAERAEEDETASVFSKGMLHRAVEKVNLTQEEIEAAQAACRNVENDELRQKLFSLTLRQQKLRHLKENEGYHPCQDCGTLCPPGESRCGVCARRHAEGILDSITRLLSDVPWLRYADVKKSVPEATVRDYALCRAWLVGAWAAKVELTDYDTVEAKMLVMLFRSLPPEQITEAVVKRTLYEKPLRLYLKQPAVFRPVRRRDYIPMGTAKES